MALSKPPIIVFDLDGTLIETAPDLLESLNHVLASENLPPVDPKTLRRFVGQGGRVMLERAFAADGRTLDEENARRLTALFVEHYSANMPGASYPFEGVMECIEKFSTEGWLAAVCTNKFEALAKKLLKALDIDERFAAICGQDSFPVRKPDPDHLFLTIDMAGGDRQNAIMIGDSNTDIKTAKNAAIPVVAVDFGYTDQPVQNFGPDQVISHFDELTVELAHRLIKGRQA